MLPNSIAFGSILTAESDMSDDPLTPDKQQSNLCVQDTQIVVIGGMCGTLHIYVDMPQTNRHKLSRGLPISADDSELKPWKTKVFKGSISAVKIVPSVTPE